MTLRALGLAMTATAALSLAGCGTLHRFDPVPVRQADGQIRPTVDPRIRPTDEAKLNELLRTFAARLEDENSSGAVLALSGGGANGAFGAGLLVGWTQTGTRPQFDIVTGISTGALSAPFAFLGPDWDDELQEAYIGGGIDGMLNLSGLSILVSPSLYSSAPLRRLIEENVTPRLLRAVAIEHAKGRRLLVVTTHLDTKQSIIWDMGVLATQGDDQALYLFRQVLLASASIPGVFPPVMIAGLQGDLVVDEMHVDGGVNMPFLAVPDRLLVDSPARTGPGRPAIYVVVNGQVDANPQAVPGTFNAIAMNSYDSMSKASRRMHLTANAAYAARHNIDLKIASIPMDAQAGSLDLHQQAMNALFDLGRRTALGGNAWYVLNAGSGPQTLLPERPLPDELQPTP